MGELFAKWLEEISGPPKFVLKHALNRLLIEGEFSSTLADKNKVAVKSDPDQTTNALVLQKQQELLRELHDLLTTYAPSWYSEELHIRLTEVLTMVPSTKIGARQRHFTAKNS